MWMPFHTLIYIYFLLPVILASVYLNFLKHIRSQLCKIILGNQTMGKHRNNACISITFSESRIANSRWRICSGGKR